MPYAMDEYSREVIGLLLERNRPYLEELLSTVLPANATVDTVCQIIADKDCAGEDNHVSSIYTCKCGSKRVVLREVQLRSADEGSTILHTCEACGNRW